MLAALGIDLCQFLENLDPLGVGEGRVLECGLVLRDCAGAVARRAQDIAHLAVNHARQCAAALAVRAQMLQGAVVFLLLRKNVAEQVVGARGEPVLVVLLDDRVQRGHGIGKVGGKIQAFAQAVLCLARQRRVRVILNDGPERRRRAHIIAVAAVRQRLLKRFRRVRRNRGGGELGRRAGWIERSGGFRHGAHQGGLGRQRGRRGRGAASGGCVFGDAGGSERVERREGEEGEQDGEDEKGNQPKPNQTCRLHRRDYKWRTRKSQIVGYGSTASRMRR